MHPGTIIAFCHLRWDFVYQRPQHLLSRLARRYQTVVVEEPVHDPENEPYWEVRRIGPQLTIYRPHTPDDEAHLAHPARQALADGGRGQTGGLLRAHAQPREQAEDLAQTHEELLAGVIGGARPRPILPFHAPSRREMA